MKYAYLNQIYSPYHSLWSHSRSHKEVSVTKVLTLSRITFIRTYQMAGFYPVITDIFTLRRNKEIESESFHSHACFNHISKQSVQCIL